jgi:outer membrane protein assembly factor BamE (lipoprotein component of BamABCDE complex)
MNNKLLCLAASALLGLTGCSSLSEVDREGHTDDPKFPRVEDVTFASGSYPDIEDLRRVRSGLTRDQIYDLLGRPHFSEGFYVREWDYLLHLQQGEDTTACQFKILFDKDRIARSVYWAPQSCAAIVNR